MSKAEEKSWEWASKNKLDPYSMGQAYAEGYHQAEKDLELSWEDISTLREILDGVEQEFRKGLHEDKDYIGYCQEVLKRFKETKK